MIQLYVIIGLIITIIMVLVFMVVLLAQALTQRKTGLPDYEATFDGWNSREGDNVVDELEQRVSKLENKGQSATH